MSNTLFLPPFIALYYHRLREWVRRLVKERQRRRPVLLAEEAVELDDLAGLCALEVGEFCRPLASPDSLVADLEIGYGRPDEPFRMR